MTGAPLNPGVACNSIRYACSSRFRGAGDLYQFSFVMSATLPNFVTGKFCLWSEYPQRYPTV